MHAVSSMRGKMIAEKKKDKKEAQQQRVFSSSHLIKEMQKKNDHADGSMIRNLSVCIRAYSSSRHWNINNRTIIC